MPEVFVTSPEWALQGLSLDGFRIPQKRTLELEPAPTCLDLLSNLEIWSGSPPILCYERIPLGTGP